jgi:DNA-binding NarL/FixJ family response regulator
MSPPLPHRGDHPPFAPPSASPTDGHIRVLVVDPHVCAREGVKAILGGQPDLRVIGEARDGPTGIAVAAELDPDVVVVESALPGLDGAQVTARLREACPGRKVLVHAACEHPGTVRLLLGMGACGYVLKRSPAENLLQAVRAVAAGGTYLDPGVAASIVPGLIDEPDELSAREVQVVRLIALGYGIKQIASRLGVGPRTVETYKGRAMEKLDLRTRVDLVLHAARSGWLTDDEVLPSVAYRSS